MIRLFSLEYTPKGRKITFCGFRFSISLRSRMQMFFRPLISVIVPVYNVEKYLPQCLDSLIKQTFLPFEIICVNDGSTDGCNEILSRYAAKDRRIRLICQNNRGLSAARNAGLKKAKGQYVLFVDSDDLLHPETLSSLYRQITRHDADICLFGYSPYTDNGVKTANLPAAHYGKNENDAFTYQQISGKIFSRVAVWCKLYRRGFIRKRKIEFPEGFVFEDVIFHIKTITSAGKICLLNRPLYCYRTDNAASITHVSAATTQLLDIVEAFDMVNDYLKEKKLLPSLSLHFCRFLYDHAGWHLKRAAEKPQKQLAEKTLSWINRHDDIRQTINADPVLQSFYSSLSPENRQTPFR